jgi:hypothetical protein
MKKLLLTMALVATTAAAFAQGKIILGNDSLHLLTVNGTPIPQVGGYTSLSLVLMGGTSAGTMTLQTTIVGDLIGNVALNDGRINNRNWNMVGVGTGATAFLQLLVFSTAAGDYATAAAAPAGTYQYGASPVFTAVTGSFANNSIVLHSAPGNSTWADAPLVVTPVPEPTSMVLAGLGAASLLLFRRRK